MSGLFPPVEQIATHLVDGEKEACRSFRGIATALTNVFVELFRIVVALCAAYPVNRTFLEYLYFVSIERIVEQELFFVPLAENLYALPL